MAAAAGCVEQGYAKGLAELRPYLTPQDFAQFLLELQAKSPGRAEALAAAAATAAAVQPPGPHAQVQAPGGGGSTAGPLQRSGPAGLGRGAFGWSHWAAL